MTGDATSDEIKRDDDSVMTGDDTSGAMARDATSVMTGDATSGEMARGIASGGADGDGTSAGRRSKGGDGERRLGTAIAATAATAGTAHALSS